MPRLAPVTEAQIRTSASLDEVLADFGALPNSIMTLAHRPTMLAAVLELWRTVMIEGTLEAELKYLVGYLASRAAGCLYCSAHTAHNAHKNGASAEKIDAIWEYERNALFSDRERAAFEFAQAAGTVPNAVEDAHFEKLRLHFDDGQIAELLSVAALYGFFNRWNDSLATPLEVAPLEFATDALSSQGWTANKHAPP